MDYLVEWRRQQRDCPIKSGNDRKWKISGNDTNKKVMAFVVVILRLDRSI